MNGFYYSIKDYVEIEVCKRKEVCGFFVLMLWRKYDNYVYVNDVDDD